MKRSEMVMKMSLHIARQAIHAGKVDLDLSWLNTNDLLGLMEEVGMLPPNPNPKCHVDISCHRGETEHDVFYWEPEDEEE